MLLPGTISPGTWLLFTVIISLIALGETTENHRLNVNFEFDLKQRKNGVLQVRDLEDSRDVNRRADDDSDESDKKPKESDSSDNLSESDIPKKHSQEKPSHKESGDNSDSNSNDDNDDSDNNEKLHSTRGLRPDDFEPEDNPKIHGKFNKHNSDNDDSDGSSRRRRKRQALSQKQNY